MITCLKNIKVEIWTMSSGLSCIVSKIFMYNLHMFFFGSEKIREHIIFENNLHLSSFVSLQFIPMPVLYGVFLYMGASSLKGIQVKHLNSKNKHICDKFPYRSLIQSCDSYKNNIINIFKVVRFMKVKKVLFNCYNPVYILKKRNKLCSEILSVILQNPLV